MVGNIGTLESAMGVNGGGRRSRGDSGVMMRGMKLGDVGESGSNERN